MTKVVISLYGGPGTGKSTTAALLFSRFKNKGLNTELVTEYVKGWVYDERTPCMYDQFYFFAKQLRREYSLFNHIDYIITDSPILMCCYYTKLYGTPEESECFKNMAKTYFKRCENDGVVHKHVFLNRIKEYNKVGRYQTEEEAVKMDSQIEDFLKECGVEYIKIDAVESAIDKFDQFCFQK